MRNIGEWFQSYQKEAWRLEILSVYKVSGEWERFQHYLKTGQITSDNERNAWINGVRDRVVQGARHVRFRVLDQPINDYQTFELLSGYLP